jgi:hypothetical protein
MLYVVGQQWGGPDTGGPTGRVEAFPVSVPGAGFP